MADQLPAGNLDETPQLPAGESANGGEPKAKAKRKRRRTKDKAPRKQPSGAEKRAGRKAAELQLIGEFFNRWLTAPAVLMAAKGDAWAASHFTTQGPMLAEQIVAECERNTVLRDYCVKIAKAQAVLGLGGAIALYVGPMLMHYGIVPGGEMLGVPIVGAAKKPEGGKAPPFYQPKAPPPPPEPEPEVDLEPEPEPMEEERGQAVDDELAAELAAREAPPPVESL
jgi:hypothetical protein